jgi:nucleotide-binding universal stress UspA family protein
VTGETLMASTESLRFEPKKILCAVDLTPASAEVLQWARLFGEAYEAKLDVVHADYVEYPPYMLPAQAEQLSAESQTRRAELKRHLGVLVRDAIGAVSAAELAILDGRPAEALLRRAASNSPDLIVIGSHGPGGFSRLRLGSVAEHVIRTSSTPTLVARTRAARQTPKIERVLCPVNFDPEGRRSLQVAAGVAQAFRAKLTVVHAVDEPHLDLEAKHRELCQWVPAEIRKQCALVEAVRHGNPAEQILLAAREQSADLIVLGAARRPFLELAILGGTAERVLRHAESAVLVLPLKAEAAT